MSTATLPPALLEKSEITEKQLKEVHDTIANQPNDSDARKETLKALKRMGMRGEYTSLMGDSQKTAMAINFKIKAGKQEIDFNEYILELEEFVKTTNNDANGFLRLRENVIVFQEKLRHIIPSQIVNVKVQLENLDAGIQKFGGQIYEFEGLVKVNMKAASTGNADDDEDQAAYIQFLMKKIKLVYFALQDSLNTYALSVALT
ncbi:hypothetical protein GALMADRAFT_215432 [Galerina marginata CBS 339.88]|uniref:Uncharacterized protein n=1 Tax=Galerina marginata (strain CBS 339.88) TaxID=685588 RepID=A0A067SM92_GALM3|nr:hypothetical protein GALMADRAFT_215432 [Galerina marginata CBS 339.88]